MRLLPRRRSAARHPLRAPSRGWSGAAWALAGVTVAVLAWNIADQVLPGLEGVVARNTATDLAFAIAIGGGVSGLAVVLLRRRRRLPWPYVWTCVSALTVLLTLGAGASPRAWYATVVVLVVGSSLLGAGVERVTRSADRSAPPLRHGAAVLCAGLVVLGLPALWLTSVGGSRPAGEDLVAGGDAVTPDLSAAGPHDVATLAYGPAGDGRADGDDPIAIPTAPVDGSAVVSGWDDRRTAWRGFGPRDLPVAGRVWYPDRPGSFPLLLIAHGNNSRVHRSDAGFAYLAEHLASHGFIAVAVDHDFLNTSALDRTGGLRHAELTRAWLLLAHLDQWRSWADEPQHRLGRRADLDSIGLVGHSRGGEAIALATQLNAQGHLPDDPQVTVPHGFAIEALLALAPSDGSTGSGGAAPRLRDVSYFAIQGSHDADVVDFVGLEQYERTDLHGRDRLKAAVYVGGANHAQFNQRWGRHDLGNGLPKHFLDLDALLGPPEQRRITTGYATAFLATTLAGDDHRALLADHRAGAAWLPATEYVSQYRDTATTIAVDVEAGGGADVEGLRTTGFSSVEPVARPLRTRTGEDGLLRLTWSQGDEPAVVSADLPDGAAAAPDPPTHVVFDAVALTDLDPGAVTAAVSDRHGTRAAVALDDLQPLRGLVDGRYLKAGWMHAGPTTEAVPQTHRLPLEVFIRAEPDLDVTALDTLSLAIDTQTGGALLLDDVGTSR